MKHVTGPVSHSSAESEYNGACTTGMALAQFRIINNELINKDPYVYPEQALLIILDSKSSVCMTNNGKDTKHTREISRRMHLVRNVKDCILHKTVWCEKGLQLADIGTNNGREDELNTGLEYTMVIFDK